MSSTNTKEQEFEEYLDADEEARVIPDVEDVVDNAGKRLNQQPVYDKIIHADLQEIHYKLRIMGIKVKGPAHIRGDNQSVLCNTSVPYSTLNKNSQSIAYHFVREGVARDEWRTAYVSMHDNPADLLTKVLPMGDKRMEFFQMLQHHIFGSAAPAA